VKSIAQQNPSRGEVLCAAFRKFCNTQLQMEMEIINDKIPFEIDPWRC
jgi:hypothetical protein